MVKRKLFLIISLGIVLLAAAAAAVIFLIPEAEAGAITVTSVDISPAPSAVQSMEPAQSTEPEEVLPAVAAPLLYTNEGKCYLASGANSMYLGEFKNPAGKSEFPKTALSGNNRYMFYLDGFDIYKGFGTLMRVAADASVPVVVAENVCAAVPSNGGTRALYLTDIKEGCGKLFLWDEKGGSKFIADNVMPELYKFSPHSSCVSYLVKEGDSDIALYIEKNNSSPSLVIRQGIGPDDNGGVGLQCFRSISVGDNGDLLYSIWVWEGEDTGNHLYMYSEGKTVRINRAEQILKFDDYVNSLIYAESFIGPGRLMYKEKGKDPVVLSDDFESGQLPDSYKPGEGMSFLVQKAKDNMGMTKDLYESNGKDMVLIAASDESAMMNPKFTCVAYERDEAFYASRKTDKGWKEERLCTVTHDEADNSSIWSEFDGSGTYLYYYDDENGGPLNRYSTMDGTVKKIIDDIRWFFVFGDAPYVINSKGNAYRVNQDGSTEQMREKIKEIYETGGGVYLTDEELGGNIYFVADGTAQSKHIGSCEYIGSPEEKIDYQVPLGDDKDAAAEILYNDSDYYLSTIENYNSYDPYLTLEEDIALAEKLLERTGLEPEEIDYLTKMLEGFRLYGQWTQGDSDKKTRAGNSLSAAIDEYKSYVYGWTEEDYECDD